MSARLLERVEQLATQRFGQGAAVELFKYSKLVPLLGEQVYHVCKVWSPDGRSAIQAETHSDGVDNTRTGVLRLMLDQLQAEEVRT